LIYDGECASCRSLAKWLTTRTQDDANLILLASNELSDEELTAFRLDRATVNETLCAVESNVVQRGAPAVAIGLAHAGHGWSLLGRAMGLPPLRRFSSYVYRWFAVNRHRFHS
jgi:predicted DCC family thiol-disulfide oxidoreductase YuxK